MNDLVQIVLAAIIPVILAITWATAAEAYAAHHFGDNTGRMMGRLTLNPFVHLNVLGTVVVPAAVFLMSKGMVLFGWGKPVPINYGHMRNPRRDMVWVSLAGPVCNLVQLLAWGIALKLLFMAGVREVFVLEVCKFGVIINAVMFAFTMLPILPFNGGRIVMGLLPPRQAMVYAKHEPWGLFIVLGLLVTGLLMNYWVGPVAALAASLLKLI
jgi:Zn-dependent protease